MRDLERLEALRLSVALALMGRPRLLAVDDTDLKLSVTDRALAWELLRGLAADGTTVLAVCSEAPEDALTVRTRPAADAEPAREEPAREEPAEEEPGQEEPADEDDEPAAETSEGDTTTGNGKGTADAIAEAGRA